VIPHIQRWSRNMDLKTNNENASDANATQPWPRLDPPPGDTYHCISGKLAVIRENDSVRIAASQSLSRSERIVQIVGLTVAIAFGATVLFLLQRNNAAMSWQMLGALLAVFGLAVVGIVAGPYIRRWLLHRRGPAVVIDPSGNVRFPQVDLSVSKPTIAAMYSVHGRYDLKRSGNHSSHPVRQIFIDVEGKDKTTRHLVHLGPTDNDAVFQNFAEEELAVPFESSAATNRLTIASIVSM